MTAYTPGPWEAGRSDMKSEINSCFGKWVYAGDRFIAGATSQDIESWDEVMANAHLIAAAPEMYEALLPAINLLANIEYVHPNIDDSADIHISVKNLRRMVAAIAKAEGKV